MKNLLLVLCCAMSLAVARPTEAAGRLYQSSRLWPAPVHHAASVWLDALAEQGVRFEPGAAEAVRAVHPLQQGQWSVGFHTELITPAGVLFLPGTLTVHSKRAAHTTVRVTLDSPQPSALIPWRVLLRRAASQTSRELARNSKTPGLLREESVARLSAPATCRDELAALQTVSYPGRLGLVAHAREATPRACRAEAIVMLSTDPERHDLAVEWFHEAWNADAGAPDLIEALGRFENPTASLEVLRAAVVESSPTPN